MIQRNCVRKGKTADFRADQAGQISAGAQGFAQIAGDRPDIGAAAAVDANSERGPFATEHLDSVHTNRSRLQRHLLAASGEVVSASSADLHCTENWGPLENVTDE